MNDSVKQTTKSAPIGLFFSVCQKKLMDSMTVREDIFSTEAQRK